MMDEPKLSTVYIICYLGNTENFISVGLSREEAFKRALKSPELRKSKIDSNILTSLLNNTNSTELALHEVRGLHVSHLRADVSLYNHAVEYGTFIRIPYTERKLNNG